MPDREKVIRGLKCIKGDSIPCKDCGYSDADGHGNYSCKINCATDAIELLKEQETLLREYEKLSQVCFKIEKYLRIADLSILIDRIEEGKVEVLQDDGRLHNSPIMETTIKIRRL